ncbi:hypothetical protein RVB2_54270 [Pseudomonas aeruginosa]|nr:hypothetical protein RVB2_54270 [Pseudomonas aeruginosa]
MAILPTPDLVGASDPAFYSKCHHWVKGSRVKQKAPREAGLFGDSWCRHQESNPGPTDYKSKHTSFQQISPELFSTGNVRNKGLGAVQSLSQYCSELQRSVERNADSDDEERRSEWKADRHAGTSLGAEWHA